MGYYFDDSESIYWKSGVKARPILETVAYRYIGQNPVSEPVFRVFNKSGFIRTSDYRYILNFNQKYPEVEDGALCYAWGKLWSDAEADLSLAINCYSPVVLFCNNQRAFKSTIAEETNDTLKREFLIRLDKGWNSIIIQCQKVRSGFGCILGTGSFKGNPFHFLAPTLERDGQEGLIFTGPMKNEMATLPTIDILEKNLGLKWYPEMEWSDEKATKGQFERIYGLKQNGFGFAWTKGDFTSLESHDYQFMGYSYGAITIYLEGKAIVHSSQAAAFNQKVTIPYGERDIFIKCGCTLDGWGFRLEIHGGGQYRERINLHSPLDVKGAKDAFIYGGVFDETAEIDLNDIQTGYHLLKDSEEGDSYWRVDLPACHVRVYHENPLFGKWNYPLGVTLYGLLQTGVLLERRAIVDYVKQHIEFCTTYYQYSLWDRKQYGAAGINSQISAIDSLDDCGAFGATMLELMQQVKVGGAEAVAEAVAHYITHEQSRLQDGALYRRHTYIPLMERTMWADDLYMSVPFLCKYFRLTGEKAYIDDAARQILLFKKYLYLPDLQIMAHVYNFRYDTATGIPWGRGNGWVFFALSELLAILREDDGNRNDLLRFFNDLAKGYLKLQDADGMWHQVLTDHESYAETSCTSMFIYGFARGIRYGWLKEIKSYSTATIKAWEGLCKIAIDKNGNIYGVCKGSGYSFSAGYYRDDLSWQLNDTHGIGIVMLAGMEVDKLQAFLKTQTG